MHKSRAGGTLPSAPTLRPRERVALGFYRALMWLAQPLFRRKLRRRARRESGYGQAVAERFGRYDAPASGQPAACGQLLWIHAVSLGETRTAGLLMQALRERMPQQRFLLTHGTATGREEGRRYLQAGDVQVWQPWDMTGAVQRFLKRFKPCMGLLIETEVWPNMVQLCRSHGVPLWLVNARLNEKSCSRAQSFSSLMRPAYRHLDAVLAQTQEDARRLEALGAPVRMVTGNIKFDAVPDAALLSLGRIDSEAFHAATGRPVVVFASSREGEEVQWLQALQTVPGSDRVQWLLVPRHPQRFDEVAALCEAYGRKILRRSRWQERPGEGRLPIEEAVWLGDSLGEMVLYYGVSELALLGASFEPLGGQNLIEACACGCPVVMGPHTFNFAEPAVQAVAAGAAMRVASMEQAVAAAVAVATDARQLKALREKAAVFASSRRGGLAKVADAVAREASGDARTDAHL